MFLATWTACQAEGMESAAYIFKVRSLASQRLRTRGLHTRGLFEFYQFTFNACDESPIYSPHFCGE
jgi:hypothetical protein